MHIIKAFFAGGPVKFAGDHYTITDHEMYPTTVQEPRPPILLVAGGPRMTRFAAAEADIVAINPATKSNEAWADQNLADASAEAVDRKVDAIRDAAGDRYDDIELQIVVPFVIPTDDRDGTAQAIADALPANDPALDLSAETVLASPYVLDRHRRRDLRHARRTPRALGHLVLRVQRRLDRHRRADRRPRSRVHSAQSSVASSARPCLTKSRNASTPANGASSASARASTSSADAPARSPAYRYATAAERAPYDT